MRNVLLEGLSWPSAGDLPAYVRETCSCQAVAFIFRLAGEGGLQHAHSFLLLPLPGVFRGGHDLLVRSRLVLTDTVTMQVTARSGEELPVDVIMASVG